MAGPAMVDQSSSACPAEHHNSSADSSGVRKATGVNSALAACECLFPWRVEVLHGTAEPIKRHLP
eukprot:7449376-Alexandrium_andersonii.AAC.1